MVDEPTPNCLCEPTPPRVWPDTNDTGTQCCVDTDEHTTFVTKRFDNVATLNQAFDDALRKTSLTMDVLCEHLEETKALAANDELKNSLSAHTMENQSLLKRIFELTEELATLKNLATAHRQLPVFCSGCSHIILLNCLYNRCDPFLRNLHEFMDL